MKEHYGICVTRTFYDLKLLELTELLQKFESIDGYVYDIEIDRETDEYGDFSGLYFIRVSSSCRGIHEVDGLLKYFHSCIEDVKEI